MPRLKDRVHGEDLTGEQLQYIAQMICAIYRNRDIDLAAFRLLVSLIINLGDSTSSQLSARDLAALSTVASSKTIDAGKRLGDLGFLIVTDGEGPHAPKYYRLNQGAFHLTSPIALRPLNRQTIDIIVGGKSLQICIVVNEIVND